MAILPTPLCPWPKNPCIEYPAQTGPLTDCKLELVEVHVIAVIGPGGSLDPGGEANATSSLGLVGRLQVEGGDIQVAVA